MDIIRLSIRASNLPDVAKLLKTGNRDSPSYSCPFAVVTLLTDDREPTVLGKTEVIENTLDPEWKNTFMYNYENRTKPTYILVKIFHQVCETENEFKELGSGVFDIRTIMQSQDKTAMKKLKRNCGSIEVHAEKFCGQAWLRLKMKGLSFKSTRGFMKKITPFYQFTRVNALQRRSELDPVHKSDKTVKSSLRPEWEEDIIDIDTLCDGDFNLPLRLSIYHHRSNGNHELVGEIDTSVNNIISAKKSGSNLEMKKNGAITGSILIEEASMTGIEEGKYLLQDVTIVSERMSSTGVEVTLNEERSSLLASIQRNQMTICV